MKKSFRELFIWQSGIDLAVRIYQVTGSFPWQERFGLTAQLRSAGVSVPSNIAEGQGRASAGEWIQFLGHARGSLNEVQTEIEIAKRLGYLSPEYASALSEQSQKIGSGLSKLIDYARSRKRSL